AGLERTARRAAPTPLTRGRLFYTRIAYRDLAVRVDGRRGPWAARYRQVVQRWVAPDGSARLLFGGGRAILGGPRDTARWRAAGSRPLARSAGRVWEVDYRPGRFVGANLRTSHLTYRDLLALPTTARGLDDRLESFLPPAPGASLERAKVEAVADL